LSYTNTLQRPHNNCYAFPFQVDSMRDAGGEQAEEADKMENDQDKLVEEIFSHEDKDKDGYISHEEFSGPKHDEL
jgi:hypothetical protein